MVKNIDSAQQAQAALSVPDFASALGISVRSAWKLVYERKVAHIKLGRRTLIPVGEIELTIALNTVPATTSKPSDVVRKMLADGTGSGKRFRPKGNARGQVKNRDQIATRAGANGPTNE